jgi:hypothetical protein
MVAAAIPTLAGRALRTDQNPLVMPLYGHWVIVSLAVRFSDRAPVRVR